MPTLAVTTLIDGPADAVFALIADIAHYSDWLPESSIYNRTTDISASPVILGTTYIDSGSRTIMAGKVTAYEPPSRLTFEQSSPFRIGVLKGVLNVVISYHLQPQNGATLVTRTIEADGTGVVRFVARVLPGILKAENERILAMMKAHLEA